MTETNNQIINLIRPFVPFLSEDIPEGTLFGCLKFAGMSDSSIDFMMSKVSDESLAKLKAQFKQVHTILKNRNLNPDLLITGLPLILRILSEEGDKRGYGKLISQYNESTDIETIISDAVNMMPKEEYDVFQTDNKLSDVTAYQKTLSSQYAKGNKSFADTLENVARRGENEDELEEQVISGLIRNLHITKDMSKEEIKSVLESTLTKGKKVDVPPIKEEHSITEKILEPRPEEDRMYSESMNAYLKELNELIPVFKEMDNVKFLWSQSLLVSVDDGFGLTTFLKEISQIYINNRLTNSDVVSGLMGEIVVDNPPDRDKKYESWDAVISVLKEYPKNIADDKIYGIFCIDLSKWVSELNSYKVKEYIRKINDIKNNVLVVFRIPYMEYRIVSGIEKELSDVMGIRKILVPPISINQMTNYLIRKGNKYGYSFTDDCPERLELGIISEKNDGHFYGFRTLNKIFDSIVYSKVKYNSEHHNLDKTITGAQLDDFLNLDNRYPSYMDMIEQMVGIDDILKQIDNKITQIKVSQELAEKGQLVERPTIHMMFKGSPGTGKTTVARIIAQKLKDANILNKGNLYEIKGRDLCGRYIGETTPKTCAYCRDAYGSVLFIDEAYELYRGAESSERDFGREALTALVAEMENHRDDMCVILAGYSDDMDEMIKGNLGLESRIPIIIDFPNYSRDELELMFFKMLDRSFEYEPSVKAVVHNFFSNISDETLNSKEFSNARFVRNLFESVWGEATLRYDLNGSDKVIISDSDFTTATEKMDLKKYEKKSHRPMGFVTN